MDGSGGGDNGIASRPPMANLSRAHRMKALLSLLLPLGVLAVQAMAAGFTGTLTAYDLRAGTITVAQGKIFNTFRFRPSVEITLNGEHAKLEQIPVGATVTITTSEPQVAAKIAGSAAAPAGAPPAGGKAVLDPTVEQLARACANLQDAELVLKGNVPRPLEPFQASLKTSTVDALKKEIAASIDRSLAIVEEATPKHRNKAFGYFKDGVTRLARNNEDGLESHEKWANEHPKDVVRGFRELATEARTALEKQ